MTGPIAKRSFHSSFPVLFVKVGTLRKESSEGQAMTAEDGRVCAIRRYPSQNV
jgi:hypothetical protein